MKLVFLGRNLVKNLDETVLRALIRLSGDKDFNIITTWIRDSFEKQKNDLIDDNNDRAAGAAEEVRELLNAFYRPKEMLDKIEATRNRIPSH